MRNLEPLQVGVMFWTGGPLGVDALPAELIDSVKTLGVACGQLGVHAQAPVDPQARRAWKDALDAQEFTLVTAFLAFLGESYASLAECEQTVGFVPRDTREEREARTYAVSDFAEALGAPGIAAHIGALPPDRSNPDYVAVRDVVRRVCDHCSKHGQTFALETGQEPADLLLQFIHDVERPNLRVNFDPANMILYGSGDPIEALGRVREHVVTVHCKDGKASATPREFGEETPLGDGEVGMERYIAKLRDIGYRGPLIIEREILGDEQRADIRRAIELLERLRVA